MHIHPDSFSMGEPLLIKHKGVFDFDGFYRMLRAWFERYRYEWQEGKFKEKAYAPGSQEIEPKWTGTRKVDEYISYAVTVEGHLWDAKPVKLKDEERRAYDARMMISITGKVNVDYGKLFNEKKHGKFIGWLGKLFRKLRYREIELKYADILSYELQKLQIETKRFLQHTSAESSYFYQPQLTEYEWRKDIR